MPKWLGLFSLGLIIQAVCFLKAQECDAVAHAHPLREKALHSGNIETYLEDLNFGYDFDFSHEMALYFEENVISPNQIGRSFKVDPMVLAHLSRNKTINKKGYHGSIYLRITGAQGFRLKMDLSPLEADDEIWLVDEGSLQTFGPYTRDRKVFWGPSAQSEVAFMVLTSRDSSFGIPRLLEVGHYFKKLVEPCQEDANCYNVLTPNGLDLKSAVGQMRYEKNGSLFVCSGTLMNYIRNEGDPFIPYFLTAAHCINTQAVARTLEVTFDFTSTGCNSGRGISRGNLPSTLGSTLLRADQSLDASFLRLDQAPAGNHVYAGWTSAARERNEEVFGLHHPSGTFMRYSRGYIDRLDVIINFGEFTAEHENWINWSNGLTEGGSSGSGLFRQSNGQVIGFLSGGPVNQSCNNPSTLRSVYGSFRHFYPQIREFLNPGATVGQCASQSITCNQTVRGTLNHEDCTGGPRGGDRFSEMITFPGSSGQEITIDADWSGFDGFLYLVDPSGETVAQNDDFNGVSASRIEKFRLGASGTYTIWVTTYGEEAIGDYTLTLACGTNNSCNTRNVSCNGSFSGQLSAADCQSGPRGSGKYAENFIFSGSVGDSIVLSATWNGFDGYLYLEDASGKLIAQNDDFNGLGQSQITTTLATTGNFRLWATTYSSGSTGTYTLDIRCNNKGNCAAKNGSCNDIISGSIDSTDCREGPHGEGFFAEAISFSGTANQNVVITATWAGFDGFLYLEDASGKIIAGDDDFKDTGRSQMVVTLPTTGTYLVWATTFLPAVTGSYELTIECVEPGEWVLEEWVAETPHPYANNTLYRGTYSHPGASQVGVHFNRLSTEADFDWVIIEDQFEREIYRVSGDLIRDGIGDVFGWGDGWAVVDGSSITILLVTDESVTDYGIAVDYGVFR